MIFGIDKIREQYVIEINLIYIQFKYYMLNIISLKVLFFDS